MLPTSSHPFFIGLLAAASISFFALLFGFWEPIFWAAVIGILFRPVYNWIVTRMNGRRSLAAVTTVILIFCTVLVPALLLTSAVAGEAAGVYARIQSGELDLGAMVSWIQNLLPQITEWTARIGVDLNELQQQLSTAAVKGSQLASKLALSAGQNVTTFMVMFFLMLYLLFFILRDGDLILTHLKCAMPLPDEQEQRLFNKFAEVSRATVKGTMVVGLVQGSLGGLIFAILGIQGAIFWAVVMTVLSLLPAVGAGLVWLPTAIFLIIAGDLVKGVILITYGVLVIGLVDNLLRPILVGRDTKMPDYLILFSTLGGLSLVGITGFVLGPVIAALFIAVWQMYEQDNSAYRAIAEPSPHQNKEVI
ncbi:MAG: AI-2E family transporter [Gammaproteobacteria bacterium]|nr:AI-2E family transporter [Gammaproteobacteria bacterium]